MFTTLVSKIFVAIEETECTYQDVMHALDSVKKHYEENGRDLLNNTKIQKVAAFRQENQGCCEQDSDDAKLLIYGNFEAMLKKHLERMSCIKL